MAAEPAPRPAVRGAILLTTCAKHLAGRYEKYVAGLPGEVAGYRVVAAWAEPALAAPWRWDVPWTPAAPGLLRVRAEDSYLFLYQKTLAALAALDAQWALAEGVLKGGDDLRFDLPAMARWLAAPGKPDYAGRVLCLGGPPNSVGSNPFMNEYYDAHPAERAALPRHADVAALSARQRRGIAFCWGALFYLSRRALDILLADFVDFSVLAYREGYVYAIEDVGLAAVLAAAGVPPTPAPLVASAERADADAFAFETNEDR